MKERCLAMGWIDYKKDYNMVPHSCILDMLVSVKVTENAEGLLKNSMTALNGADIECGRAWWGP